VRERDDHQRGSSSSSSHHDEARSKDSRCSRGLWSLHGGVLSVDCHKLTDAQCLTEPERHRGEHCR
jgi:hypothetical protein